MQVNLVSILSLAVLVLYLQMGLFVLWKNPMAILNRNFFYVSIGFAFWSMGLAFYNPVEPGFQFPLVFKLAGGSTFIIFPFLLKFFSLLSDLPRNDTLKKWLFWGAMAAGLPLMYASVFVEGNFERLFVIYTYQPIFEPSAFIVSAYIYYLLCILAIIVVLLGWRRKMKTHGEVIQFRFVFVPMIFSISLGLFTDLILPLIFGVGIIQLSHAYAVFWLGGVAYGIIRFRFFALTPSLATDQVLNHNNQIMFFCQVNGQITRTNPFTASMLNLSVKEVCGNSVSGFFVEEMEVNKFIDWALVHGFSGPAELSLRSAQGEYIAVTISVVLLKDRFNDVQGMVLLGQDNREAIRLRNEILIRKQVENKLIGLSEVLEARVKERTSQLASSYRELQIKMTERLDAEEKIKSDIVEKELIINEIHYRVKNNMTLIITLINSNISKENPEKVNRKFLELAQRVNAILLVHHHLYLSLNYSEVDFSGFLQMLVGQISELYTPKKEVKVELNLSEVFLEMGQAIPLGVIVNEIISNSFCHAFGRGIPKTAGIKKWKLSVEFMQVDGYCHLKVSDNGKGLPKNFDIETTQTNGLQLVQVLVNDQINGTFKFESQTGTTTTITFPLPSGN